MYETRLELVHMSQHATPIISITMCSTQYYGWPSAIFRAFN